MKNKAYLSIILAAVVLLALSACGKTQPPAVSDNLETATQQTEQQNDVETSANEDF